MAAPAVSVIIPCFNLGAYLAEAADSVLSQTVDDYEILVGDDGSNEEETRKVVAGFARPKTRVFRFPHRGLAATRNALIAEAHGTYLCALDADDRLRPTYLEQTLQTFERDSGLTFVGTRLQMFGTETGVWPGTLRCDLAALLVDDTVHTAALVRRDAVLAAGGYDERMPVQGDEDWDLWISIVERGGRGVILDEVLFDYRRRDGSMVQHCQTAEAHRVLHEYIVAKHAIAYRTHWQEVVESRESDIAQLRAAITPLERSIATELAPGIARRTEDLARMRLRIITEKTRHEPAALSAARDGTGARDQHEEARSRQLDALHAEYARAMNEIRDLRQSWSWRLTAPLRAAYDRVRKPRP